METTERLQFELMDSLERNKKDDTYPVLGPLLWDIRKGITIALGRHEENKLKSHSIIFKSKVVSRQHAEIGRGENGKVYIKDVGSSSGTFLNMKRLSDANKISKPAELKDGDILRIGTNYHGGLVEKYRCVVLRVRIFEPPILNTYPAEECCICLFGITAGEALFVTPCRHILHYKCSRPLLAAAVFCCPLCRYKRNLDLDLG